MRCWGPVGCEGLRKQEVRVERGRRRLAVATPARGAAAEAGQPGWALARAGGPCERGWRAPRLGR